MRLLLIPLAAAAWLGLGQPALADDMECFDLKVRAKPVAQIPTEFPNHEGYIVLSWPWFVDLRIKHVLEGNLDEKDLTALAVLHSRYLENTRTFLLRRNHLGGFNILRPEDPDMVKKCAEGVSPMRAYLRPADGMTLDDYRRTGEEQLRRYYDEEED